MNYLEGIADGLALKVLADPENLDDNTVVDLIAAAVSSSSATLQETFLTAVRIRRAEIRAYAVLDKYNAKQKS
ncbi:MAG: hypothetical protein ACU0C9_00310 [Paracoccaceae bacterium]